MRLQRVGVLAFLLGFSCVGSAQTTSSTTTTSDPQAVAFANQALLALTGGNAIVDAALNGTAIRIVGGDQETGTVALKVKGTTESRIDLALSNTFSEVRNDSSGQSYFFASDQTWHPMAGHNCETDAAWFFPALSSLALTTNPTAQFTYIGQETWNGVAVQHIRVTHPSSDSLLTHLSTMDFYLASTSLLPVSISFALHPDIDAGRDIPTEIRFANYQTMNGVRTAFRIQKIVQGSLFLDLTITNVAINTGLQDSTFTVSQ